MDARQKLILEVKVKIIEMVVATVRPADLTEDQLPELKRLKNTLNLDEDVLIRTLPTTSKKQFRSRHEDPISYDVPLKPVDVI